MVGKPLHADRMTSSLRRLSYARICIEIDIEDSLPDAFNIELEDGSVAGIQIVYNWVPKRCSVCKEFGHLSTNCKKVGQQVWIPKPAHPITNPPSVGDWRTVESHRKDGPAPPKYGLLSSSNSFAALSSDEVLPPEALQAENAVATDIASKLDAFDPSTADNDCSDAALPAKVLQVAIAAGSDIACVNGAAEPSTPVIDSRALSDDSARDVMLADAPACDLSVTEVSSPGSACARSSSTSSSSSTPLLARKLCMVDEVERKLGRKKKDKRKPGSSGSSRGNLSKFST